MKTKIHNHLCKISNASNPAFKATQNSLFDFILNKNQLHYRVSNKTILLYDNIFVDNFLTFSYNLNVILPWDEQRYHLVSILAKVTPTSLADAFLKPWEEMADKKVKPK